MKKNYSEKLKSPKWQKKRLEVLNRDSFKCRYCKDDKTELHVHHLRYEGYNPEDTSLENLETVCKHCHNILEFSKGYYKVLSVKNFLYCRVAECLPINIMEYNMVYIIYNNSHQEILIVLYQGSELFDYLNILNKKNKK